MRSDLLERGFEAELSVLYRSLREMEEQGLVVSRWSDSTGGPRRRVYTLRSKGRTTLQRSAAQIKAARRAQTAFLRSYDAAQRGDGAERRDG